MKHAKDLNLPPLNKCLESKCGWGKIYSRRFGVKNFPCIHSVQNAILNFPERKTFSNFIENSVCEIKPFQYNNWVHKVRIINEEEANAEENTFEIDGENGSEETLTEIDNNETEEIPLVHNNEQKFLFEVTKEVMKIQKLGKEEFISKLIEISSDWGTKTKHREEYETEESFKAAFKFEKWCGR
jgi:hypothetical protein